MLRSSPPGKFVLTSWQIVITTSGAFKSLWSEQDGDLTFLHKIQWFFLTLQLQNDEWRMCIIVFFLFSDLFNLWWGCKLNNSILYYTRPRLSLTRPQLSLTRPQLHWHAPNSHWHAPDSHWHAPNSHWHAPDSHWHAPNSHWHAPYFHWHAPNSHWHAPNFHWHAPNSHWHAPNSHWHAPNSHWHAPNFHWHAPNSETRGLKKISSFPFVTTTLWWRSCAFNS